MGIACVTPKPLCSLTEQDYGVTRRQRIAYENVQITEFARYFGQPELKITVDPETRTIEQFVLREGRYELQPTANDTLRLHVAPDVVIQLADVW